jgi:hypothetical protein
MRGYMHWRAKSESEKPSFKVTLSDLPQTMEKQTHRPPQAGDGEASYIVSWNFDECNCLPYVEPSKAENTADKEPTMWEEMAKTYGCIAATNMLYQDLAWMEGFADMSLREQVDPDDIGQYKDDVQHRAEDIWNNNQPSIAVRWPVSLQMDVDPDDCSIHGIEKAKELAKQLCLPDIIFEQVLAHEQLHIDQCLTYKKFGKQITAPSFGRDETHAHVKGIEKTLGWLEKNCNQVLQEDIAQARERLNTVRNSPGFRDF